ncbi:SDR family NAD(P)-dependent oxidoreductase [Sphingobium aromaticiconvertens]|uniref:SDR family NAD(P)-dependent oxidoreductase n=1 Tax=Sphingobium aromaticiconvertens TaxID=365341 RepID=UPI00301614A9
MERLEGRVAIVTGSGGIGAASAIRLAAEGARVVIGDIDVEGAEVVVRAIEAKGGVAIALPLDIGDEESIVAFITAVRARYSRLDVLHNNAAATGTAQMGRDMAITMMKADIWDTAFRVNTRGTMLMIKHAIPLMLEGGGGSIINTSSGAALRGDLYGPAYAASKAAINCLTMYVATQYGKQGIRCNVVSPGLVATQNVKDNLPPEQLDRIETHKLTPYLGAPEDIAAAVAYLASDDARFVTAQVHVVDGGIIDHMPYFAEVYGEFTATPGQRIA